MARHKLQATSYKLQATSYELQDHKSMLLPVELKAGAQTTPEDIVAHCKKHLAGFKVPRAVVFGERPKTSTGKIREFELRKQAKSSVAIDV